LVAWKFGFDLRQACRGECTLCRALVAELERSQRVRKAVLLALDGVYDAGGNLEWRAHGFSDSEPVRAADGAEASRPLSRGRVVNPQRRDALDELEAAPPRERRS
jgi:hypothetical protein